LNALNRMVMIMRSSGVGEALEHQILVALAPWQMLGQLECLLLGFISSLVILAETLRDKFKPWLNFWLRIRSSMANFGLISKALESIGVIVLLLMFSLWNLY